MPPLESFWDFEDASTSDNIYSDALSLSTDDALTTRASKRRRLHGSQAAESVTSESALDEPDRTHLDMVRSSLKDFQFEPVKQQHCVKVAPPRYPRSFYETHRGRSGLEVFTDDVATIELSDFAIYRPRRAGKVTVGSYELTSLEELAVKNGHNEYIFDGTIQISDVERRLISQRFDRVSIEGYGTEAQDHVTVYIQFEQEHRNTWFVLKTPSHEYLRYYTPFIWTAQFTKYFIDYASDLPRVKLQMMRRHFIQSLQQRPQLQFQLVFKKWFAAFGHIDFRQAFVRNAPFIYKEISSVAPALLNLQIWKDINFQDLFAIPAQPQLCAQTTVVTPYVYDLFKICPFGSVLQSTRLSSAVAISRNKRLAALGFLQTKQRSASPLKPSLNSVVPGKTVVSIGDVVVVSPDTSKSWERTSSRWYAYVMGKKSAANARGSDQLEVLWLYSPRDTTLKNGKYPHATELLLSNNCNCGHTQDFEEMDVTHILDVDWIPEGITDGRHFVRQRYCTEYGSFSTLDRHNNAHFLCKHKTAKEKTYERIRRQYKAHDTVLVKAEGSEFLEPFVIDSFDDESRTIRARALLRVNTVATSEGPANELAWTEVLVPLRPSCIRRKCNIRFYPRSDTVPVPYNRNGRGDCFYVSLRMLLGTSEFVDIDRPYPERMTQGFVARYSQSKKPLAGLSLFSGGGNFDLGLQDSGAVKTSHFVEWDPLAAHTLRANVDKSTRIYCGSVDDYLKSCLEGKPDPTQLIARIGDIAFVSAGSPCQGFSTMQKNKASTQSLTNASKVASVASFIDLYRPKYALLENVLGMGQEVNGVSALDQLLCAIVGMGYQVKVFNIVACTMGDPQHRCRLFISVAARGLTQPDYPPITHLDDKVEIRGLGCRLGKTINGLSYGEPEVEESIAPFVTPTAAAATKDLPAIEDAHVGSCIPYPDHRLSIPLNDLSRLLIRSIPRTPQGLGISALAHRTDLPRSLRSYMDGMTTFRKAASSSAWKRAKPDRPFATIVTRPTPSDSVAGGGLVHWEDHRILTVMEVRRAQGFHDNQIVLGNAGQQWKIIGNSVSRGVALALGLSLRRAYMGDV